MTAKRKSAITRSLQSQGETRVHGVRDISLSYEGRNEQIQVRPPNLSAHGMFVNTARIFPEGAVLNLRFRLAYTNVEVQTRCEVRHCIPGVGVGVEFIGISPDAQSKIAREIEMETKGFVQATKRPSGRKKKQRRTT
jgi:hypothetical protein